MARSDKSHGFRNKVRRFAASALYLVPGQPGHGTAASPTFPSLSRATGSSAPHSKAPAPRASQSSASPPKPVNYQTKPPANTTDLPIMFKKKPNVCRTSISCRPAANLLCADQISCTPKILRPPQDCGPDHLRSWHRGSSKPWCRSGR